MKVAYISNYGDLSGYSYAAEGYIKALFSTDIELVTRKIRLCPRTRELSFPNEEGSLDNIDACIIHSLPDFLGKIKCDKVVSLFAWETSKLPDKWVKQINKYATNVVVPNKGEAQQFLSVMNKISKPIHNIPHAFSKYSFCFNEKANFNGINKDTYVFYTIGELNTRKNLDSVIFSYLCEFDEKDDVVLFIHSPSINSGEARQNVLGMIEHIKKGLKKPSYPKIIVSSKYVSDEIINSLHSLGDTYISLSKGESWNIPLFYAYAFGNKCIATECSGHLEYIDPKDDFFVESSLCPCFGMDRTPPHLYTCDGRWRQAIILSVQKKMREQFKEGKIKKEKRDNVINEYSYENVGKQFKDYLCSI